MPIPVPKLMLTAALALVATGSAAVAWWQVHREQATVRLTVPALAPFDPAFAAHLGAPPGFTVSLFASGLKAPRMMDIAPDGSVLVTRPDLGDVIALRDADGDGVADQSRVLVADLPGVHGIALAGGQAYLASSTTVWRVAAGGGVPEVVIAGLPDGGQHANRMVRIGPDGDLYVSVGSSCNDCAEDNLLERATIIRYGPDGQRRSVVANGLRNTIGYDWQAAGAGGSAALWGMDHGSDFRGDAIPPEELNRIEPGANYGWPICYGARVVDGMTQSRPEELALEPGQAKPSGLALSRKAYCGRTHPALLTLPAHAAPMAMRFYRGAQFPAEWRNDAFVALHGSWNRGEPVGYKVVRLRFSSAGEPVAFEDFLTGFLGNRAPVVLGRPVGIAIGADGALLVSDDANGAIYRVAYTGR